MVVVVVFMKGFYFRVTCKIVIGVNIASCPFLSLEMVPQTTAGKTSPGLFLLVSKEANGHHSFHSKICPRD